MITILISILAVKVSDMFEMMFVWALILDVYIFISLFYYLFR
jgi:hypothetical protein